MEGPRKPAAGDRAPKPGWLAPIGLVAVAVGAAAACVISAPWDVPALGAATSLVSLGPLLLLVVWTFRARHLAVRLSDEVEREHDALAGVFSLARRIRAAMREAREHSDDADPLPFDVHRDGAVRPGSAVALGLSYAEMSYLAGAEFRVDRLRELLAERALRLVESLQRYPESAFYVGIFGTVTGLVVQTVITQELTRGSVLSQAFLTGIVLKGATTAVGLLVAWYARSLASTALTGLDEVMERTVEMVGRMVGPLFRPAIASTDMSDGGHSVVDGLRVALREMSDQLKVALRDAVSAASERLERYTRIELAQAIETHVVVPLREQVGGLTAAMSTTTAAVRDAADRLTRSVGELHSVLAILSHLPERVNDNLGDTFRLTVGMREQFADIARSTEGAARVLRDYRDELTSTIATARDDGRGGRWLDAASALTRDLQELAHALRAALENVTPVIEALVRVDGADGGRPGNAP